VATVTRERNQVNTRRNVKVSDLVTRHGGRETCLLCRECHAQYSTDPRDYWLERKDHVLRCCSKPLRLVVKVVTFETVVL